MQSSPNGAVRGVPLFLLRLEGAVIFSASAFAYASEGRSWWLFAALFFMPDLSMLGYLASPKIGAASYNAAHTLTAAALLAGPGFLMGGAFAMPLATIWVAHIGFARMAGYGLKYGTGFADTHLGRLGARERAPARRSFLRLCRD
jgi:hypothetical protein